MTEEVDSVSSRSAETDKRTSIKTASTAERWECLYCGSVTAHWTTDPIEMDGQDGCYRVEGFTYEHCDSCGEDTFDAGQIDAILIATADLARVEHGRLSPADIHDLRLALGLTQARLEAQLGVSAGTVGRWERGTVLQNATADRLMRILWAHPELLDECGMVAREGRGPYRKRK